MSLVDEALSLGGQISWEGMSLAEYVKDFEPLETASERMARIGQEISRLSFQSSGEGFPLLGDTARLNEYGKDLSTCHIPPQITIRSGASILTVKRSRPEKPEKMEEETEEKPKRGKVSGFSRKSGNRLMRTLAEVRRDCLPVFVTLTFPNDYPTIERAKRDLDTFIKRASRKFPNIAGVWKLEPQRRGAPHFHLLVWGASFAELLSFVPLAWYEVVGSGDENHLLWHKGELGNSPCVQQIESQRGAFWYVKKYMSKEVSLVCENWGRWWGVFHRDNLPLGEVVNVEVTEQKAVEFIRYMRRYARIKSRAYKSLTIICHADFWVNRLL